MSAYNNQSDAKRRNQEIKSFQYSPRASSFLVPWKIRIFIIKDNYIATDLRGVLYDEFLVGNGKHLDRNSYTSLYLIFFRFVLVYVRTKKKN